MMRKLLPLFLILALAILPGMALAESQLRVQGNATLTVSPDTAMLNVGYTGENADSNVAQQTTADTIVRIVEAVKEAGVEEADIVTAYLNTYPVYNYSDNGSQSLRGYHVEHMLGITVKNLDDVGKVLDTALKAGANQAYAIDYVSSQAKEVYMQAMALAVENATAKADALAIASGVWLGGLSEVNEIVGYGEFRYGEQGQFDKAAASESLGSTLMTNDLTISASVELVYAIR